MNAYVTLLIEENESHVTCLLNRPDRRNALNPEMISELTDFFGRVVPSAAYRCVVLRGSGGFFCAGADLYWMKDSAGFSKEQNLEDARRLFDVFAAIDDAPTLTIAAVEGGAYGGGIGLVSCCDIAVAEEDCRFSLSEVRLGLSPATISPFVTAKIGLSHSRQLMLSALPFNAPHGLRIGLLHEIVAEEGMDACLDAMTRDIQDCAPNAVVATKRLLPALATEGRSGVREMTAELIASLRTGEEGQEGLASFLEKRKPAWSPRQ